MLSASTIATRAERPMLAFGACRLPLSDVGGGTILVDCELGTGELILLHADEDHERTLNDAICGLLTPVSGTVRFDGRDWRALPADMANALRGRIGVAFSHDHWVPHLTVLENVILAQRHHRSVDVDEVCRAATQWAQRFGLPGIPADLPGEVGAFDRLRANLARAFIGDPDVILIEHLGDGLPAKLLAALVNTIRVARNRGALVVWSSRDLSFVLSERLPASRRLQLAGDGLRSLEGIA